AWVLFGDRSNDGGRAIAGAVVHHDDFKRAMGLVQNRSRRLSDEPLDIVRGDNDADEIIRVRLHRQPGQMWPCRWNMPRSRSDRLGGGRLARSSMISVCTGSGRSNPATIF